MQRLVILSCLLGLSAGCAPAARAEELLDEAFGVKKVAGDCKFTEGPALDAAHNLYFSDYPNDRIMRLSSEGELSVFRQPSGGANGMIVDQEDRLVICQARARRVARLEKDGTETILAETYNGRPFFAPNDVAIDSRGRIYFTDIGPESGPMPQPTSGVYRIDKPGEVTLLISNIKKPNGILVTPDDRYVYVSDRYRLKLMRYFLQEDGTLKPDGDGIVYNFIPERSIDGMWLDVEGNVYGAAGKDERTGLWVISPEGKLLLHKQMPEFATNVIIGGPDGHDMYFTAGTSVYKMRTKIAGARLPPPKVAAKPASD
jgi:gluconolactonase